MPNLKFRPPLVPLHTRVTGARYPYLIRPYVIRPDTINKMTLRRIHGQIHYFAWHSPIKNAEKWRRIEKKFLRQHKTADDNWL
jgi:hypothetical protein